MTRILLIATLLGGCGKPAIKPEPADCCCVPSDPGQVHWDTGSHCDRIGGACSKYSELCSGSGVSNTLPPAR